MLADTTVFYSDPFVQQTLTFDGKDFGVSKSRTSLIASRVSYNDIVIHSFKVNASVNEEELKTMVEIKMYEEAGLDLQKQYKISYIRKELEFSDMVLVEGFAVDVAKATSTLTNVMKTEKYIDFLALPFLAFSALYVHKILAPSNDLFVYIAPTEAFLALYKEGRYIATKSILNLEDMIKRLKREEIEITLESLETLLVEKGLDATSYTEENIHLFTALQTVFSEVFTKINDVVMHNRNVFGFDSIDRIFMSTSDNRVKGLKSFLESFGYTATILHDFKLIKNCEAHSMNCILASYAYDCVVEERSSENVTFLVRPPQFSKTEVGKLSILAFFSLAFFSLYPLYYVIESSQLEEQYSELKFQDEATKKNFAQLTNELTKVKNQIKVASEIKEEQAKALENIAQSVDVLYSIKGSSQTYVDFIAGVNQLLKEYKLLLRSMEQKGANKMILEVVATENQRDTIAKFMEALLAKGFLGVTTEEIRSEKSLYISKIEISR